MTGLRRRISLVAFVWLLSHVSTLALSFAGLCCNTESATASVSDDDACCQGLAPGQMCPLHKHRSGQSHRNAPPPPDSDGCRMRSGCDAGALAITGMTLDLGLQPDVATEADVARAAVVMGVSVGSESRGVVPDLPPPRA